MLTSSSVYLSQYGSFYLGTKVWRKGATNNFIFQRYKLKQKIRQLHLIVLEGLITLPYIKLNSKLKWRLGIVIKTIFISILVITSTQIKAKEINSKEYGDTWPFTVESGELNCIGNAVTFTYDGIIYGVNGVAKNQKYADIYPIWANDKEMLHFQKETAKNEGKTLAEIQKIMGILKVNISDVLNDGLSLCH